MAVWNFIAVFIAFVYISPTLQDCSGNFTAQYGGKCFIFVVDDDLVQPSKAKSGCRMLNATLASIDTEDEETFLQSELRRIGSREENFWQHGFWTSGVGRFENWHWVRDSSHLRAQGCFSSINRGLDYFFTGLKSDNMTPPECVNECVEKSIIKMNAKLRYAVINEMVKYDKTVCACKATIISTSGASYPYSGYCTIPCDPVQNVPCRGKGTYEIFSFNGTFSNWYDQDSGSTASHYCAAMDRNEDYRWVRTKCTEEYGYICQKDAKGTCDVGFDIVNGRCLKVEFNELKDWFEARSECLHLGADLVSMEVSDDQHSLEAYLSKEMRFVNTTLWIGATSYTWKWGSGDEINHFSWGKLQPATIAGPAYVFLQWDIPSSSLTWGVGQKEKKHYVCEKEVTPLIPDTTPRQHSKTSNFPPPIVSTTPPATSSGSKSDNPDPEYDKNMDAPSKITGKTIGIIVGVFVVVIIAIIITSVVIRKRKSRPNLYTPNGSEVDITHAGDIHDFSNPMNHSVNYSPGTKAVENLYEIPKSESVPTKKVANKPSLDGMSYDNNDGKVRAVYRTASGRPVNRTSDGAVIEASSSGLPDLIDSVYLTPKDSDKRSSFENPCYRSYEGGLDDQGDIYEVEMPEPIMTKVFDFENAYDNSFENSPKQSLEDHGVGGPSKSFLKGQESQPVSQTTSRPVNDEENSGTPQEEGVYSEPEELDQPEYSYAYMPFDRNSSTEGKERTQNQYTDHVVN